VVILRPAMPEDAADVAGVHVRSWQVGYRDLMPGEYLEALRPEDRMARYTFGSASPDVPMTIVATDSGVLCGFATTRLLPRAPDPGPGDLETGAAESGELLALYVDPSAWGLGIGQRLITDARTRLRRLGCSQAVLWVLDGNERAQRFYAKDGWADDGTRRSEEVWGASVDERRFHRHLS
jgi:GNAT superfamily N-acetyltransferase